MNLEVPFGIMLVWFGAVLYVAIPELRKRVADRAYLSLLGTLLSTLFCLAFGVAFYVASLGATGSNVNTMLQRVSKTLDTVS